MHNEKKLYSAAGFILLDDGCLFCEYDCHSANSCIRNAAGGGRDKEPANTCSIRANDNL